MHQDTEFLFATEVPGSDGFDERRLFVSRDNGASFAEAEFPFPARHNHFKVVDASEGVAFVLVQHTVTRMEEGNGPPPLASDGSKQIASEREDLDAVVVQIADVQLVPMCSKVARRIRAATEAETLEL